MNAMLLLVYVYSVTVRHSEGPPFRRVTLTVTVRVSRVSVMVSGSGIALNKYRLFALSVLIPVKADCTIVPDLRNGGPSEWRTQIVYS